MSPSRLVLRLFGSLNRSSCILIESWNSVFRLKTRSIGMSCFSTSYRWRNGFGLLVVAVVSSFLMILFENREVFTGIPVLRYEMKWRFSHRIVSSARRRLSLYLRFHQTSQGAKHIDVPQNPLNSQPKSHPTSVLIFQVFGSVHSILRVKRNPSWPSIL